MSKSLEYYMSVRSVNPGGSKESEAATADLGRPEIAAALNALAVALANRGLAISAIEVARVLDVVALEKNTQPAADEGGKPWLN